MRKGFCRINLHLNKQKIKCLDVKLDVEAWNALYI